MRLALRIAVAWMMLGCSAGALAQSEPPEPKEPSPWLLAPVFNSSPKLGVTVGATVGYLHKFDPESRPSIFAITGQYTSTESIVAGAFARTSPVAGLIDGSDPSVSTNAPSMYKRIVSSRKSICG